MCVYIYICIYIYICNTYHSLVSCSLSRSLISTPAQPPIGLDPAKPPRLEIPAPQTRLFLSLRSFVPCLIVLTVNSRSSPSRGIHPQISSRTPLRVTTKPATILGGPLQTDRWL